MLFSRLGGRLSLAPISGLPLGCLACLSLEFCFACTAPTGMSFVAPLRAGCCSLTASACLTCTVAVARVSVEFSCIVSQIEMCC